MRAWLSVAMLYAGKAQTETYSIAASLREYRSDEMSISTQKRVLTIPLCARQEVSCPPRRKTREIGQLACAWKDV